MNKKEKIAKLQKKILSQEPTVETINEYVLTKFPDLKKEYKNHPLETTQKKRKNFAEDEEKDLFDFLCFLIEISLKHSNDYMDDEKKNTMRWVKKQTLLKLMDIFVRHINTPEAVQSLFKAKITASETKALENIITDCWQLAYLEKLTLPEKLRILSQILVDDFLSNDDEFSSKTIDNITTLISQMKSQEILETIKKVEPKEPYLLLYRLCYELSCSDADIEKAQAIVTTFQLRWEQLSEKEKAKIGSL